MGNSIDTSRLRAIQYQTNEQDKTRAVINYWYPELADDGHDWRSTSEHWNITTASHATLPVYLDTGDGRGDQQEEFHRRVKEIVGVKERRTKAAAVATRRGRGRRLVRRASAAPRRPRTRILGHQQLGC